MAKLDLLVQLGSLASQDFQVLKVEMADLGHQDLKDNKETRVTKGWLDHLAHLEWMANTVSEAHQDPKERRES